GTRRVPRQQEKGSRTSGHPAPHPLQQDEALRHRAVRERAGEHLIETETQTRTVSGCSCHAIRRGKRSARSMFHAPRSRKGRGIVTPIFPRTILPFFRSWGSLILR